MKGFIKILESIIASIVILSAITFFFSYPKPSTAEQTQFNYVLAALQKNGSLNDYVKSNDAAALNTTLKDMLPATADFSVEISGIPNPVIKIACVCSDVQETEIISRLSPLVFSYRSRTIEIRIDNGNSGDFSEMANSNADILFFFSPRTFTPAEQNQLVRFLQNGTLFMIANLGEGDVDPSNPNVVMDDLFGLAWDGALPGGSVGAFVDTTHPDSVSYRISRYYSSLAGDKNHQFNFIPPEPTKNNIKADSRTVVAGPVPLLQKSIVKINEIGSRGRTAWLRDYDAGGPDGTELNRLLKAIMLWASGERFGMDPQFKIIPEPQSYRQYNYIGVLDSFEPFLVSLKIWNVFF